MIRRILGALLVLLGALGIALSAFGVIRVWRAADELNVAAHDSLVLISDTLTDVDRSLDVASATLDGITVAIDGLQTTTLDVSRTLSSTKSTVEEMADLTEDDLPQSIDASLMALDALEETAVVIDGLLRSLQQFGLGDYSPEMPLDQAVADAATGLEAVPGSLRAMGRGLRETSASLADVQTDIGLMGGHMEGIRDNAVDADEAVQSYRGTLEELQTRLERIRQNVERPIRTVAWAATLLLAWIGLSQLAIVHWGIDLWQDAQAARSD